MRRVDERGQTPHVEWDEKAAGAAQVRGAEAGIKAAASVRMDRKGNSEKDKYVF